METWIKILTSNDRLKIEDKILIFKDLTELAILREKLELPEAYKAIPKTLYLKMDHEKIKV